MHSGITTVLVDQEDFSNYFANATLFFLRFYLFIFRERGREGERKAEKHQCVVASRTPPTGDLAYKPGMCSDWASNP